MLAVVSACERAQDQDEAPAPAPAPSSPAPPPAPAVESPPPSADEPEAPRPPRRARPRPAPSAPAEEAPEAEPEPAPEPDIVLPPPPGESLGEYRARMDALFNRVDQDRDGVVADDEWAGVPDRASWEREDVNQDRRLTREEFEEAVNRRFRALDEDGDGLIQPGAPER